MWLVVLQMWFTSTPSSLSRSRISPQSPKFGYLCPPPHPPILLSLERNKKQRATPQIVLYFFPIINIIIKLKTNAPLLTCTTFVSLPCAFQRIFFFTFFFSRFFIFYFPLPNFPTVFTTFVPLLWAFWNFFFSQYGARDSTLVYIHINCPRTRDILTA